ncbi:MAG: c-type cytochrome [Rhizobiaceae bacterium]
MKRTLALALVAATLAGPALAEGSAADGEKVFKKCQSCHMVGPDAKAKVGPILNNVMGATAGTNADFGSKYSGDLVAAGEGGLVWNEETMTTFLAKPKDLIKKTKMSFAGLKKPEEIENVIAYIKTFSPDYKPAE